MRTLVPGIVWSITLLICGCGRVAEVTEKEMAGRWDVINVTGTSAPHFDQAKPPFLLLKSDHRFEGQLMKANGFYAVEGGWKMKKRDPANPLGADTVWSLHLDVTQVDGAKTYRYETDMAYIGGRLIDVWNGPDEQVAYKKSSNNP